MRKLLVNLLNTPASREQYRLAFLLTGFILLASLATLPFGTLQLPEIKPFLPAYISWSLFGDLFTGYLLVSQFRATHYLPLLMLATMFLYSGLIAIPHLLTYPGVFTDEGLLGAGSQTSTWFWVFWHTSFSVGLLSYLFADNQRNLVVRPEHVKHSTLAAIGTAVTIIAALTFIFTRLHHLLPVIIQADDYRRLVTTGVGPGILTLHAIGLTLLLLRKKGDSVLHLWLSVAAVAAFADIAVTLFAGARYSLGWYVARINSLVSSTVVLCAIIYEANRLYVRLSEQQMQLVQSQWDLQQANEKLLRISSLDGLTEIPNRRRFDEVFLQEAQRAARQKLPLSLIFLDVDFFKRYNDHFGHQSGDHCLKSIARMLESCLKRPADLAARYGGEEFAIILPETDLNGAKHVAEIIRTSIEAMQLPHPMSDVSEYVTVSIGICTAQVCPLFTPEHMLELADQALYQAKAEGRNRVCAC